jgi:hypothetical protein
VPQPIRTKWFEKFSHHLCSRPADGPPVNHLVLFPILQLLLVKGGTTPCRFLPDFAKYRSTPEFTRLLRKAKSTGNLSLDIVALNVRTPVDWLEPLAFITPVLDVDDILAGFRRAIIVPGCLEVSIFIESITEQIQAGKRKLWRAIIENSPKIIAPWLCGEHLRTRYALEKLFVSVLPGSFIPSDFPRRDEIHVRTPVKTEKQSVVASLVRWDSLIRPLQAVELAEWSREEKYKFVAAIRCWHFLTANFNGFTAKRMALVCNILLRFQSFSHADRHVIALINFYFAFPAGIRGIDCVFGRVIAPLKVYDEGFFQQLTNYLSHLSPSRWAECMRSLTKDRSQSLPELVSLWTPYANQMPSDCAVVMANLCLSRLAGGHFEDEALRWANGLFARIPEGTVESGKLGLTCGLDWITRGSPLQSNVEFLLEWSCDNSPDFAKGFVNQFESIFTGPIEDPEVRTVLLPIFLKRVFIQGEIKRIETLVAKVKQHPRDPAIIAALFGAMSKLGDNDLRQLGPLTSRYCMI